MSNYVKYAQLTKLTTDYARRMDRLSKRIFGEVARPTNSKSMKVVKLFSEQPVDKRREVHAYYPRHVETGMLMLKLRHYGLYRDEHADFKEEMDRMRALRGKVKPYKEKKNKGDAAAAPTE
ncbi:PREDICTED: 28S ribosomal protein S33, mitochondrial [Nicrophorus vespilloides]|uniref:Small ribosomal subunit protein mS33 n=1 Tax=Nicrophorus vespilloides TaxID=110193 RepID=A0ABM1NFF6_NICVS|nr:PREDICTED: 28S ribosomal protein S33, mitochondrial [Nicrophorus vespilloides]